MSMTLTRTDAIRAALVETVRHEPQARRNRIRRRLTMWAAVGIASTAVLGTAGTFIVESTPVTATAVVHCLKTPDRGANGLFIDRAAEFTPGGADAPTPVELCSAMWAHGAFQSGHSARKPADAQALIPAHLSVCVMDDGSAAVIPGGSYVCQVAGLRPAKS